jgi:hypothetical protein
MLIRNIELLQQWFRDAAGTPDNRIWFTLNEPAFLVYKRLVVQADGLTNQAPAANTPVPAATPVPTPTPTPSTAPSDATLFQRSIKRSPSDYTKFKDDSRWKQWNRHLKATANTHGLSHVLDPYYEPLDDDDVALFALQNTFMYSVFETCLQTPKSRHCVQRFEVGADAQGVYNELLSVYEEDLTVSLLATDLRTELTLLRFDDKWKRSSESFLQHWQCKVLELEQLEDTLVPATTKRLWLTTTLATKTHMANCLTQAKVTELTLLGMNPTGYTQMPWENFYNLILALSLNLSVTPTTLIVAVAAEATAEEPAVAAAQAVALEHLPEFHALTWSSPQSPVPPWL